MKHYKSVEFLSNMNDKPPCSNVRPLYSRRSESAPSPCVQHGEYCTSAPRRVEIFGCCNHLLAYVKLLQPQWCVALRHLMRESNPRPSAQQLRPLDYYCCYEFKVICGESPHHTTLVFQQWPRKSSADGISLHTNVMWFSHGKHSVSNCRTNASCTSIASTPPECFF